MGKKITKSDVEAALDSFETAHESLNKASEQGLEQPEGADLGNPVKEKMSDAAKAKKPMVACKADMDEEETHEGDEEREEEAPAMPMMKKTKKSFSEDMPEEIQTKIDVSEFLKSLVDHTGECIDELAENVAKSERRLEGRYTDLTSAVEDVQKSQAKIGIVLKAICQRIGIIENQPARAQKSETVAKSGASERKFASGLEGEEAEPVFKSLSKSPAIAKSQISEGLCDLVRKGEANDLDVIGFETNGFIRPELMPKLKTILN
jgi:hypothetical protein